MVIKLTDIEMAIRRFFVLVEVTRVTRYVYVWVAIAMIVKFSYWAAAFAENSTRAFDFLLNPSPHGSFPDRGAFERQI